MSLTYIRRAATYTEGHATILTSPFRYIVHSGNFLTIPSGNILGRYNTLFRNKYYYVGDGGQITEPGLIDIYDLSLSSRLFQMLGGTGILDSVTSTYGQLLNAGDGYTSWSDDVPSGASGISSIVLDGTDEYVKFNL